MIVMTMKMKMVMPMVKTMVMKIIVIIMVVSIVAMMVKTMVMTIVAMMIMTMVMYMVMTMIREAIRKKASFFRTWSKRGGGFNRNQKVLIYFFPLLFDPLLDTKLGEGVGDHIPKVLKHFLPKFWVNI